MTQCWSSVFTNPIATPATGFFNGIPASIIAKLEAQTVAIELEPLDSVISDTTLIAYSKSVGLGRTASKALLASFPWPISLRFGLPTIPASPTEKGGKL